MNPTTRPLDVVHLLVGEPKLDRPFVTAAMLMERREHVAAAPRSSKKSP